MSTLRLPFPNHRSIKVAVPATEFRLRSPPVIIDTRPHFSSSVIPLSHAINVHAQPQRHLTPKSATSYTLRLPCPNPQSIKAAVRALSSPLRSQPDHPYVPNPGWIKFPRIPSNVFIVHRGPDTKEKEAPLIYDYLRGSGYFPFLDVESLMPGKEILDGIDEALCESKLGIIIFSPRFGESGQCLDELVRLIEMGKPLLPIFSDIEPSELRVADYRMERDTAKQVKEYTDALDKAKQVLGLRFQPSTGNWSKLGRDTVMAVDRIFVELGEECPPRHEGSPGFYPACEYTPGLGGPGLG
ncbi:hypothetical protein MLD38_025037 [Melastoma candidum]|uniref:Uncharacterized protein n=1 Tax=Melastoma candidum TaxID=119954 RepID=A0ACB9NX73_9MYRT|nr:hypothetical protein MLD38_025037 [Melastoma candidum]